MEIDVLKKLIKNKLPEAQKRNTEIKESEKYYRNENDILESRNPSDEKEKTKDPDNPMRNADTRVSHPWHRLLVDQKAAYTMTEPPTFDVDDKNMNNEITKLLGDNFGKVAKTLAVNASNAGTAWLHVWKDENQDNFFRYNVINSKQIIPIYSKALGEKLIAVLRVYDDYTEDGELITMYEYWNNEVCQVYSKNKNETIDEMTNMNIFDVKDISTGETITKTNEYRHEWGEVPFIPFHNNTDKLPDLKLYKKLIDVYDKVYSGFVNDIDDFQEIIFVLTNYGGEERGKFLQDLRNYKTIKVDDYGESGNPGVDTLQVEIPVEARDKLLEMTREAIFIVGQGVDPQKNIGQNNSGAALKYMYSLLELKASSLETEFREGFATLVRFILRYSNKDEHVRVQQNWNRTMINNDLEMAEIVSRLSTVTSKESIAKSNPLVDDWENELEKQKEELDEEMRSFPEDDYRPESESENFADIVPDEL